MKRSPLTIAIGAVLIVIFGLLLFTYEVRKSQVVVVTRFGKVDRVNDKPGLGFCLPWPIEHTYPLDQRIQNFDTKLDEVTLPDQNIILLLAYVGWRIDNPAEFFPKFAQGNIQDAERILEDVVRSAKNEVAGQHPFSDFVSADPNRMKYSQIEQEILDKVDKKIQNQHYGLDIKFVHIKQIALPESVTQTVFNRMTSDRQYYITKITSEGAESATKITADADKTAAIIVADANSQALRLKGQGEADMIQSLQILQQNPALATFNMKIDALQQFLSEHSTLILDPSMPPLNLLQLPKPESSATNHSTMSSPAP
jgi:membrane protease subunit HflC